MDKLENLEKKSREIVDVPNPYCDFKNNNTYTYSEIITMKYITKEDSYPFSTRVIWPGA